MPTVRRPALGWLALLLLAAAGPRTTVNLNPGWRFARRDVPAAPATDDSHWQAIGLFPNLERTLVPPPPG